ncbi:unnamed protein product [Orchesella dallaii]|uniref:Uncharacterized protein n=1 Tax=Orchesella dallaii TaxID=48710 RepID=A0ABP1Q1J7_9HEXA
MEIEKLGTNVPSSSGDHDHSQLVRECLEMTQKFQEIPSSSISPDDSQKIQLIVQRLSARPTGIYVAHLYQIQQSLLCSALNILATYFVVLIQLRPSVDANLIDKRNQTLDEKQLDSQ